jgi:hypothetical protein
MIFAFDEICRDWINESFGRVFGLFSKTLSASGSNSSVTRVLFKFGQVFRPKRGQGETVDDADIEKEMN